jgi:hypothetical protein
MQGPDNQNLRLWADDPASFSSQRISRIGHGFALHPLMQLPNLQRLAKSLYTTKQCRFIKPGTTQKSNFYHHANPHDGRDIDEVFSRITEPGSWIALYNIETDPEYAGFLRSVVDAARPLIEAEQSGIHSIQGFLFISTPPSITPFHIDRENNLWLQIHGRKIMSVWDHRDRDTVPARHVENFIQTGALDNVKLTEANRARAHDFDVTAATGIYFPSTSPHMTSTIPCGEDPAGNVSISVGVVFYTDQTRLTANAHILNRYLRKLGLKPSFAGESRVKDRIKYPFARALVWLLMRFRGLNPKPGILPGK